MRALLAVFASLLMVVPVGAERLVSTVSNSNVQITSSFDGATLSFFGNILPDLGAAEKYVEGPFNVVIVVTGPLQDRVARLKTNRLGIWTNTDEQLFEAFPSFYAVLASGQLDEIATAEDLERLAIRPQKQASIAAGAISVHAYEFGAALIRMMSKEGHLSVAEGGKGGVSFLSDTAYVAQVSLPSDVANGAFIARTLVFKDHVLVADKTEGFAVRKSGFERFVFVAARQQPLLYGLVCVMLALGTGWLAGVVFKR
jgi:uncharacterized protein (TIGR02186 family)